MALTGVQLAAVIKMSGKPLRRVSCSNEKYPQSLINVKVTDKHHVEDNEDVKK